MNIVLWVLQVLLGAFFVMSGYGKAFMPWEALQRIPWIDGVTHGLMIFIGWSEMLGAAFCLKHTIAGDFNAVSIAEVEALLKEGGSGRVQR